MTGANKKWSLGAVPLPTLLPIIAAVVSVVLWLSDIRTEVSVVSKAHADSVSRQAERDARQDEDRAEMRRMWREDIKSIHQKLDRLIEHK